MIQRTVIKLISYDTRLLDSITKNIVDRINRSGSKVVGPIPLPTKISRFVVNRSPHTHKKSREKFEQRLHFRLILIDVLGPQTAEVLTKIELPNGVDIKLITNKS